MSFLLLPFSSNSIPTIFCNRIILQQIRNLKKQELAFHHKCSETYSSRPWTSLVKPTAEEGLLSPLSLGPTHHYLFSYLSLLLFGRTCIVFYSCLDSSYFSFLPKLAGSMDES